ncbi:peptide ABC transporter substrate-binding protein [Hyphobacterium marinum]|uniref:Peptide ABC transporter substrate-binding protein n=1 Tax=Hyphobacterium marinum TaxID=3116574 RepID=A0ABU7M0T6_9PROT|nr:peptide ABC transporter substrate-binding protein [Hyphobacterium sp. Y6023]MEE2567380.1 peptide ABC transporter substrate-binding protein [Hyphobacterium sp. Y6023]
MIRTRTLLGALLIGASSLTLAACGGGGNEADSGLLVLHRGNSAEPLTLDPHKASGTWENNIIGDMFIGLFTDDENASPIPGMAESWDVSEDGLVWTFHLREATWSDGVPVTAGDFEYAFQRILDPNTLAQYASLLYPIQNANAVNTGQLPPEEVGVVAIDDRTLEIRLEFPAPYLPGLLTHYTTFPVPRHVVEEHGDQWVQPRNIVTNGPFRLEEWATNNFVHVVRNERFFDNENVCLDEIYYYPTVDSTAAARRVRNGELDLNNEFPGQHIDRLREEIPDFVRVNPYMGTVYYSANTEHEDLSDARVRNALGMSIDRDFLAREIYRDGRPPAYSMVPPGVANYAGGVQARWADIPVDERREMARELLIEAGYGPDNPLEFEYTYRATADNPRIAPVVQQDWQSIADWVNVTVTQIETQIHYENLRAAGYEVGDGGWIADYNDPYNFLFLAESQSIPMNYSRYQNPAYDELVARANRELDMEVRASMLAEAEQMMIDDMPIIPIVFYINRALVNPNVTGWEDNVLHIHRSRYLCFADADTSETGDTASGD